jgi:hypothetical protein
MLYYTRYNNTSILQIITISHIDLNSFCAKIFTVVQCHHQLLKKHQQQLALSKQ